MACYVYPAVFAPEKDGLYSVDFPDLESCYTSGDNLADAIRMAEDVLALTLYEYERDKKDIPIPSKREDINLQDGEFINDVAADTLMYHRKNNRQSVKKTLTIPEWLNDLALTANLNFSQVLQDALKKELKLT